MNINPARPKVTKGAKASDKKPSERKKAASSSRKTTPKDYTYQVAVKDFVDLNLAVFDWRLSIFERGGAWILTAA